jgi:ribosomal protein L16 Arg81 hydroxylase
LSLCPFVNADTVQRFYLSPPNSTARFGNLHPWLHPSARSAIADIDDPSTHLSNIPLVEVLLEPGDVLYLPAFWYHRVVAESTSISANIWTNSEVGFIQPDIEDLPIPFESEWSKPATRYAIIRYIDEILKQLSFGESATEFVRRVVITRYAGANVLERYANERIISKELNQDEKQIVDQEYERFVARAQKVVTLLEKVYDRSIQEIIIGNVIETYLFYFLGLQNTLEFLASLQ